MVPIGDIVIDPLVMPIGADSLHADHDLHPHGHGCRSDQRHHGRPHPPVMTAVEGADLMLDHDEWGAAWIQQHRTKEAEAGRAPRP